jgi:hypothetical protein
MAILSQRAYARQRGVSVSTVQKAIDTGRISTLPTGQIDSDLADEEWARNTQTHAPAVDRRGQADEDGEVFGASQYTKARAVREHYQARLAKIEYEERVARLVSKDEVQVAAFNTHRVIRDAMLNIPDRVAAMLAAETDEAKCHEMLSTEIRKALNEFADALA